MGAVIFALSFNICNNLTATSPCASPFASMLYRANTLDDTQAQPYLKHAFVQQSGSKHSGPLSADVGVITPEQVQGVQFDTVQV